jgi:hypothetical protein
VDLRLWPRPMKVVAVAVIATGLLSGCGGEVTVPVPNVSTVAEEANKIGEGAVKTLKEQLGKLVDFNKPVEQQLKELEDGANKLYCDLKGSPPGQFVRDAANAIREDIVKNNPGVTIRPLNFSDKC